MGEKQNLSVCGEFGEDLKRRRRPRTVKMNKDVDEIARRERVSDRYVWRLIRVGFLAPSVVEAIIDGRQPAHLSASTLTQRIDLPALWKAQEQALGLA